MVRVSQAPAWDGAPTYFARISAASSSAVAVVTGGTPVRPKHQTPACTAGVCLLLRVIPTASKDSKQRDYNYPHQVEHGQHLLLVAPPLIPAAVLPGPLV